MELFWIIVCLVAGTIMLYFGSEWLVRGGKGVALRLGVSPFVIGLTILAFGSSAPEAVTSIVSASNPEIILGNVVGSNIANIGLAIGLAALVGPMAAKYADMRLEICTMVIVEAALCLIGLLGHVEYYMGIIMILALFVFLYVVFKKKGSDESGKAAYEEEVTEDTLGSPILVALIIAGLVLLYFGIDFTIEYATDTYSAFNETGTWRHMLYENARPMEALIYYVIESLNIPPGIIYHISQTAMISYC